MFVPKRELDASVTYMTDLPVKAIPTRLTPQSTFSIAAAIAAGGVVFCFWLVQQAPWFGIHLDATSEDVGRIISLDDTARTAGLVRGDRVIAFSELGGPPVHLQSHSLVSDVDQLGSFAGLRQLFVHAAMLYRATDGEAVTLHLEDGRMAHLPRISRPLSNLPAGAWVMAAGVIPFMVGAGVWSYRRREPASQLLLLAGASFMVIALSNLVYAYRQPSLEPLIFEFAVYINRLSSLLFYFSYIAVFWVYPRRLGSQLVVIGALVIALLFFINELTQTVHWPGDPFAFPLVATFPLSLILIGVQWRLSRHNPVDRAALQWFVFALMTGMILVTGLYFLPGLVGAATMLPLELAFATGIVSYLGLILAVVRFRLFQLGEWWLTAWMWLLGGVTVIALDMLIAYLINVAPAYVIALSLVLVGWVYFPMRQWLWLRYFWHGNSPMTWVPGELLETVVSSPDNAALTGNWHILLGRLFRPLHMEPVAEDEHEPRVGEEGINLYVPDLVGGGGVRLAYRNNGSQLFSPSDIDLVRSLLHMARPAVNARLTRQAATQRERERIMRDLHDDVSSRLLTLSHRLRDPDDVEMVNCAMQALRETIYSLNRPEGVPLENALADWRHEILERLDSLNVELDWLVDEDLPRIKLSVAQRANLNQILREAVSNAVRHGHPQRLWLRCTVAGEKLLIELGNDGGRGEDPAEWRCGVGQMSMRRRMDELKGTIEWKTVQNGCVLVLELPLGSFESMVVADNRLHVEVTQEA